MKLNKYTVLAVSAVVLASCSDIDNLEPQGGTLIAEQVKTINAAMPERADASFSGMYLKLGQPSGLSMSRPDDFSFIMMAFSNDLEGADMTLSDNGYNWFSVCGEYTSRNANYANPYIRYASAYNEIALANTVITSFNITEDTDSAIVYKVAQAKAVRAFSYLNLAPYYQQNYQIAADKPCVPIVTEETTDFANNPRASVKEVYDLIVSDLTYAVENLEGYDRGSDKSKIDQQVAYGLRARAYLDMGEWVKAAADADKAMADYTPATIEEISKPSFYNLADHNWIWGYDMTVDQAMRYNAATSSAWLRSFSGDSYSAATQNYARINTLLYNKIPTSDVRKYWWVDEDLYSPLIYAEGVSWKGKTGKDLANLTITNVKTAFLPYTNVKFGMYTIGGTTNEEDWPFMRVEEMILIKAEALYRSGDQNSAKTVLNDFVSNYRNPRYNCDYTQRGFLDEVWFQRRVELWGEGFAVSDIRRLNKPLVRFHDNEESTNFPAAYRFNMTADDGWWLLRFTTSELNTNFGVVDNEGGSLPVQDQNPDLKDGVTD